MTSTRGLIIRLVVFTATMMLLLGVVFQALSRPVDDTVSYRAMFTDANGLRVGNDVRLFGVRVGKISAVALQGVAAEVTFTMKRGYPMYANNTLAIRYQNLSGQRFLDVQQAPAPTGTVAPDAVIGVDHTVPAFDITTLFNGLQPVLAELSPADLNTFATGMLAVIEGNGTGLGPALGAIEKLSSYATDRQAVVSTIIRNLSAVADQIGGSSGNAMVMLTRLTDLFVTLQERIGGLIDFAHTIPPVLEPTRSLLNTLGLTGDPNPSLNALIRSAIPDPAQAVQTLNTVPTLMQSLTDSMAGGATALSTCSRGNAEAPPPLRVLIDGQRITLCNG